MRIARFFPAALALLALGLTRPAEAAEPVRIVIDAAHPRWTISPCLVGLHQVYYNVPDSAYADGRIARWARRTGIGTSRFPGGNVVKSWDWEHPTGVNGGDPWAKHWNPADQAPDSQWMSLDEYLAFVKASGIRPLLGVNALSGEVNHRRQDGIDRAARMVQYVKERGYGGALWYIGNEEEGKYAGKIVGYAKVFREYATAMKAVDPDIRIFWNLNNATPESVKEFLRNDGGTADGLETHGKWPIGGRPKDVKPTTSEEWLGQVPLHDGKNHQRVWRDAANACRAAAAEVGRPNLLVANNEFGIGQAEYLQGFNRYTMGLAATEFLMEHFIGNWFSACFYDMALQSERGLLDGQNGYRFNPHHFGMEMLANAQGGAFLNVDSSDKFVHGFAAIKGDACLLYLLNKTLDERPVHVRIEGPSRSSAFGRLMRDTEDHYGSLASLDVRGGGSDFDVVLPPLTFAQMALVNGRENPLRDPEAAASNEERWPKTKPAAASQKARKDGAPAGEEDPADADAGDKDVEPGKRYVYKTSSGEPQALEVYFPKDWGPAKNRVPGVMMFHGGAWGHGDLNAFRYACKYLASRGLVAATANYKLITAEAARGALPEGQSRKRVGIIDAKSAIRWMKQHAAELRVDPERIIVGGGSAGGHLAVLSTINTELNDPTDPQGIDTKVVAYLLFNPAFTPVGREEDSEVDVFPLLKPGLAPSIMFFGTEDKNWKPGADELAKRIKANGDETVMWTAKGQEHGFFHKQPWYDLALIEADHFLAAHGLLSGSCTLSAPASGEKLEKAEP